MKYVTKLESTGEIISVVYARDAAAAEYEILKDIEADAKIRSNCEEVFLTSLRYLQHSDLNTAILGASAYIDEYEDHDLRYIIVETPGGEI